MKRVITELTFVCASFIAIGLIFTGLSDAKIDPKKDIAALWLFDEGKGKVATDTSPNGNDGEFFGSPTWVDGKFGKALEFNGTSDYVQVPDSPSLDIEEAITIVAWVNWKTFKDAGILSKSQDGGGDGNYFLSTGCGGGPTQAKFGVISAAGHTCGPASAALKPGQWYHVAGTFDGKQLAVYIDGALENAQNHGGPLTTSDWPVIIGSYAGLGFKSNAIIDELAVFNVALDEKDINTIMNEGLEKGAGLAVSPKGKLATVWAEMKTQD